MIIGVICLTELHSDEMSVKKKVRELEVAEAKGQWDLVSALCSEVGRLTSPNHPMRWANCWPRVASCRRRWSITRERGRSVRSMVRRGWRGGGLVFRRQ